MQKVSTQNLPNMRKNRVETFRIFGARASNMRFSFKYVLDAPVSHINTSLFVGATVVFMLNITFL